MDGSSRLRGALLLLVAVLLGACARSQPVHATVADRGEPASSPSASSPAGSRAGHHRPYSDVNPPPRSGGDFVVKVLVVSRAEPTADGRSVRPKRSGPEFWGEEVRTCVRASSSHSAEVGWQAWRAVGTDGRAYPADPDGGQPLRTPVYPFHRTLAPGQCATGWFLITVPRGTPVRAIQFAPEGGRTLIEWPTLL